MFLGDYNTTETVDVPFNAFSSDDPSASVTITNLAAGDVEIHKDGSTTQRASDNGVTVSIDFDTVTGNHMVHVDLSDNSDAGYYAAGSRYAVRMEGTTIDGATINAWIGSFSIGCVLRPTTAGRTLDVESDGVGHADVKEWIGTAVTLSTNNKPDVNVDEWGDVALGTTNPLPNAAPDAAGGLPVSDAGGLDLDAKIGALQFTTAGYVDCGVYYYNGQVVATGATTNLPSVDIGAVHDDATAAANAEAFFDGTGYAGTNNVIPTVTTLTGHTAQTGDTFALANGAAGFVAIDTVVDAILADTNSLNDTKIPQTLNLTASGNIGIDWANVENPTTVVDLSATDIQLCDTVTTNSDMRGTDGANTTVPDAAGTAAGLHATSDGLATTIAGYIDTEVGAIKAVTDKLATTIVQDGGVYDFTAAALAAAPSGSGASVAEIWAGLDATQLAKFCTVDTGETIGVAGSVAKISQGAAGGNVTVGAFTQAALANFADTDTGETAAVSGSVAQLARAGISISVGYTGSTLVGGGVQRHLACFQYDPLGSWAFDIVDLSGSPLDVTGNTYEFRVFEEGQGGTLIAVISSDDAGSPLVVSGTTVTLSTVHTVTQGAARRLRYALRDVTASNKTRYSGDFVILEANGTGT
jgi:hypothetical protein